MNKICRKCNAKLSIDNCTPSFLKFKYNICRKCNEKENKLRHYKNRESILLKLGGACVCCNIKDIDVLSIDHINGGGINDRKSFKSYHKYLKYLVKLNINELLEKYQCLCFNCNYAKGFFNCCPHNFSKVPVNIVPIKNRGVKNIHLNKEDHKRRELSLIRLLKLKLKIDTINAYGGKCIGCKETSPLFLTLDHINNNGNVDLLKSKGTGFYNNLKLLGFPGKDIQLQLLCHNCNARKEYINKRKNGLEITSNIAEIYLKNNYSISKEEDRELWKQAEYLFERIPR